MPRALLLTISAERAEHAEKKNHSAVGRLNEMIVPFPGRLSAPISPPWAVTRLRESRDSHLSGRNGNRVAPRFSRI
jgi:hypothetical protein